MTLRGTTTSTSTASTWASSWPQDCTKFSGKLLFSVFLLKECFHLVTVLNSYLEELEVLRRDVGVGSHRERFHLSKFWRAEKAVEEAFEDLHSPANKWQVQLDFNKWDLVANPFMADALIIIVNVRECFERVRDDEDQKLAAEKIANFPVVVVSGRGGTGKTEVVTSVLEEIEELAKKEGENDKTREGEEDMFADEKVGK